MDTVGWKNASLYLTIESTDKKDSIEVPAAPDSAGAFKRGEAGDTPAGVSPALSRNCNNSMSNE